MTGRAHGEERGKQHAKETHADSLERKSVECYLLGELTGDARERFEDHLFDCSECTAELKSGITFLEMARAELEASPVTFPVRAKVKEPRPSWFARLWQPGLLAPAFAACLAVIVYQSAVVVPKLRSELAHLEQPSLLEPLVLANAGARGDTVPEIVAPPNGSYLLSVDIPLAPGATSFRCTLFGADGTATWHVDVPVERTKDAVSIQVPDRAAKEGMQELRVETVTHLPTGGDKLGPLVSYRYKLTFAK